MHKMPKGNYPCIIDRYAIKGDVYACSGMHVAELSHGG